MGSLTDLANSQAIANQNLLNSTNAYASNVGELMTGYVLKAAGKELLADISAGKNVDTSYLLKMSQKYNLGDKGMKRLSAMLQESGAMSASLSEAKAKKAMDESDVLNAKNEVSTMKATGLSRKASDQIAVNASNPPPEPKAPTDNSLITSSLTERLGRKPTAQEILDEKGQRQIDLERNKVAAKAEENASFSTWNQEEKDTYFEANITQGVPTVKFAFGDRQSWNQYEREFAKYLIDRDLSGSDLTVVRATYDSLKTSLTQQQKNIGAMGGFVRNINKQLDRIDELMKGGEEAGKEFTSRFGVRAFDIPLVDLRRKVVGSGDEAILEAYMLEISNEIGKLSTGSSQSVRELSVEAQARWMKIHDPNLSLRDNLMKVLEETRHMGDMRMAGAEEESAYTKDLIRGLGKNKPPANSNRGGVVGQGALEEDETGMDQFWK